MNAEVYYDDMGNDMRTEPIPEDMREQAEAYHNILIEAVAENDEELMEKYLEGEEITDVYKRQGCDGRLRPWSERTPETRRSCGGARNRA